MFLIYPLHNWYHHHVDEETGWREVKCNIQGNQYWGTDIWKYVYWSPSQMFCCLIPHFLFKKHFWKCDRNDYSESYTIELEHFIKHFTFSAKPQDFGRNEISKYRLSDLNLSSSRKTLQLFWSYKNWSMKP